MARRRKGIARRSKYPTKRGRLLNPRQKKEVKSLIKRQQETKYFLTNFSSVALSATSTTVDTCLVPQGDTDQSRDADRLFIKKLYARLTLTIGDTTNFIRIIAFQWKPNTVPTGTSILLNGPSGAIDVWSHYHHDNRQEYKILFDRLYHQEGNATANYPVTTTSQKVVKFILSRKINHQVQYAGGTTTGTNHIYITAIADSSVVPHPLLTGQCKLMFTDS